MGEVTTMEWPAGEPYDCRISLHKLVVFCLVVELGGISRAADHLYVAQPVVTAHVQSLQKRLGVKLLYREGHRMLLTDEGQRVYEWARETRSRTRELVRDLEGLADGDRGVISVAASMTVGSYLLPSIIGRFRRRRPRAQITLSVSDPEHAVDSVASGDSDFATVVSDGTPTYAGLQSKVVGQEEIVLVAARGFEPRLSSVPTSTLADIPMISSPAGYVRRSVIDRQLARLGVHLNNVVVELGHPEAMKKVTLEGLGACLLFRTSVAAELEAGTLRHIPFQDARLFVPLMTVVRVGKRLSPIALDLLEAIETSCLGEDLEVPDLAQPAPVALA
jgi:LysR family transcriptional regulator, low CO2-responsive transcriptional regulator